MGRRKRRDGHAKKKHELNAELAFWYHIDPFGLDGNQKLGLKANLARVKAQHRIHCGNYDAEDYRGVYELFLTAYGDEQVARKARLRALENYVDGQIARTRRKR